MGMIRPSTESSDERFGPTICFRCEEPLKSSAAQCKRCHWNGGIKLSEDEDRYLVLVALIHRVLLEGTRISQYWRIAGSPRELAVLQHGDQSEVDGAKWRITGKNVDRGIFLLRGFRILRFQNYGKFFEFAVEDPVEEIKEEMMKWRDLNAAYFEIMRLKNRNLLRGYLRRPEKKKVIYRNGIQDESPYLG